MIYDVIVVGAGAAGIYMADILRTRYPNISLIVLEAKNFIGGRTRMYEFDGQFVPSGAYGVDPNKDDYIIQLLERMGFPSKKSDNNRDDRNRQPYINEVDIMGIMDEIACQVTPDNCHLNTKTFMIEKLGAKAYNDFVITTGYRDFEEECITDTLTHYGMSDNTSRKKLIGVEWNSLWEALAKDINVEYGVVVDSIIKVQNHYGVTSFNRVYYGSRIIIATDILSVKRLLPMFPIYNQVHINPFIRIYGCFNKIGTDIMKEYVKSSVLVASSLQRIIPINHTKGLYMIAYADNANAQMLSYYIVNNKENRNFLETMVADSLSCPSLKGTLQEIRGYYTYPGTHYFSYGGGTVRSDHVLKDSYNNRIQMIYQAQRPLPNVFVIGECLSVRQGWVNGALLSVHSVIEDVMKSF